jgi:hypothetical protein
MIIRIVKMTFKPELVPQFEALFEETKKGFFPYFRTNDS